MLRLQKNDRILVVVAHPDDELLGLGGTMNKFITSVQCKVRVIILGEGITSRGSKRNPKEWEKELLIHKENIQQAGSCIGYTDIHTYDLPDNRFDTSPLLDIVKIVEKHKDEYNPNFVFTHHGGDLNIDHQRTFEAVMTAFRPIQKEDKVSVLTFETPSGTEWRASTDPKNFIPNIFVELNETHIEAKIKGMESYKYEKRDYPHPRSPKALMILAQYRGQMVGFEYAECFELVRSKI